MATRGHLLVMLFPLLGGCAEIPANAAGGEATGAGGGDPMQEGRRIEVPVHLGDQYVDLAGPSLVSAAGPWDLKLVGGEIYTNGGVSGTGHAAAFGPLSLLSFLGTTVPEVPFLTEDRAGGAFLDWYDYESATHALYTRFHVYGVRRGDLHYKVQILGYYGEQFGAPVSALYSLRVAAQSGADFGPSVEIFDIDGTAGGLSPSATDPSACLRLDDLTISALTPAEAMASVHWDLCFRRDSIVVNGGSGGPAGVRAVNLMAAQLPTEQIVDVKARTKENQLAAFDAVDLESLLAPGVAFRPDGVVSAFSDRWLDQTVAPPVPVSACFFVQGRDGTSPYYVLAESVSSSDAELLTVSLRIKEIEGDSE